MTLGKKTLSIMAVIDVPDRPIAAVRSGTSTRSPRRAAGEIKAVDNSQYITNLMFEE
jgi:hypothetical protein